MTQIRGRVFIISGPSRVGKDAIVKALLRRRSLRLKKVLTATSRKKRKGEIDGRDYYFFTRKSFEQKIKDGYFLEWAILRGGEYFGTPRYVFNQALSRGEFVILNIDVQGAEEVADILKENVVRIFIKPESIAQLKRRMSKAGFTKAQIQFRLADAKRELKAAEYYDYVVVNREGRLKEAVDEIAEIIFKLVF